MWLLPYNGNNIIRLIILLGMKWFRLIRNYNFLKRINTSKGFWTRRWRGDWCCMWMLSYTSLNIKTWSILVWLKLPWIIRYQFKDELECSSFNPFFIIRKEMYLNCCRILSFCSCCFIIRGKWISKWSFKFNQQSKV